MRIEDHIRPLIERFKELKSRVDQAPVNRWGTVGTVSPLTVALDGSIDTAGNPVFAPARSAVGALLPGARVWCTEQHRRITVVQVDKLINWTTPVLLNSFTPSSSWGAQWCVTPHRVELRGGLYRPTAPSSFTTAFQLPPDVPRPRNQVRYYGRDDGRQQVAITSSGEVQIYCTNPFTSGIGYALDGIGYAY